jgi:AraC-like DNA-binding protein
MNDHKSALCLWEGAALYTGVLNDNGPHRHHAAQACLGLNGPLEIFLDGRWHETRFALIPANTLHQLGAKSVKLTVALIDGSSNYGRQIAKIGTYLSDEIPQRLDFSPSSIPTAKKYLNDILDLVVPSPDPSAHPIKPDPRITSSMKFIEQNIDRVISATELAELTSLSQSRFLHLFSQSTGLPMRRYILWRRIILTINAIKSGADLTSAAHLAGFSDSAHFSRTFRESFGLAPTTIFKNSRNVQVIT